MLPGFDGHLERAGWRQALLEGAAEIFEKVNNSRHDLEAQMDELYRQVERDFLAEKPDEVYYGLPSPITEATSSLQQPINLELIPRLRLSNQWGPLHFFGLGNV